MYRGEPKRYLERYFIAWVDPPRHLRNRTAEKIEEIRWWTLDEMRASTETFLPEGFVELIERIMVGDPPFSANRHFLKVWDLKGKVAIVTGGAHGTGSATCAACS